MNGSTDWLSAIGILLSGLVVGFMFIYTFRKRGGTAAVIDQRRLDLEAKRDALIEELRDPDLTPDERTRLELETAKVLRELDATPAVTPPHTPAAAKPHRGREAVVATRGMNATVKGFLWGVGSVAAVAALGFFVYSSSKDKTAPGQPQSSPMTTPQQAPSADPAVQKLEQAVSADPDNADKRIALARAYLGRENMMGVFEQTNAVLTKNPDEPRAQTYNAIALMAMGQLDQATKLLESATKHDPKNADAWVALAWIRAQRGDKTSAKEAIDTAITNIPADADRLRQVWTQMSNAPAAQPASVAAAPDAIHLTLSLDKAAAARSGVVYIIARPEGQTSGPPVAVKRINVTSFPITVDLSSADSMMGQPLPQTIHLEARLDTDGDAATKNPTDPHATVERATPGATIALTLK